MDALAAIGGILTLSSLGESKRKLMGKCEYLRARIEDIEGIQRAYPFVRVQRVNERKRDTDLPTWVADGRKLLEVVENLLIQVDECDSLLMCTKMTRVVDKFVDTLALHDEKGDMLYSHAFSDRRGPHGASHLPVKDIVGRPTLSRLAELKHLLLDTEVGRIAIHGREGIGKTFLMKHLHNCMLNSIERVDNVFWVSFSVEFSVKHVQDAVAAVVKCDFSSDDDLDVRARELSKKLGDLGSFVLFLDGVPKTDLSLDQIGIPVPAEGSDCKLVVTTSSTTLGCRMLVGFETVELERLSEVEAFQLFMREAKINLRSNTLLNNIPRLLTRLCHGVPHMVVKTASHMCSVDDLHEWKFAQFELENLEKRSKQDISGVDTRGKENIRICFYECILVLGCLPVRRQ